MANPLLRWLSAAGSASAAHDKYRIGKQKQTDRLFADQLRADGTGYISLYRAICPDERCRVTDQGGLPLAFDFGHLTASGSSFVAQQIKRSGAL